MSTCSKARFILPATAMRCDAMQCQTSHGCFCSKSFAGVGHKSTDVIYSLSICDLKIGIAESMNWALGPHHGPASVEVNHHLATELTRSFLQLLTVRIHHYRTSFVKVKLVVENRLARVDSRLFDS